MYVIVTEKLSVAVSIAGILGLKYKCGKALTEKEIDKDPCLYQEVCAWAEKRKYMECQYNNKSYVLIWLYGNLFRSKKVSEYEEGKNATYPFMPAEYGMTLKEEFKEHFKFITKVINSPKAEKIYLGSDPDLEGQLLGEIVLRSIKPNKPLKRLWLESITTTEVKEELERDRNISDYYNLYTAGRCRNYADWAIGINYSYKMTNKMNDTENYYGKKKRKKKEQYPVGRIKLVLLSAFVKREMDIQKFKAEITYSIKFGVKINGYTYEGDLFNMDKKIKLTKEVAKQILNKIKTNYKVISVNKRKSSSSPPGLFNLSKLIQKAYSLYEFTAKKTTEICQGLYRKKLISYPRTSSCYLKEDQVADVQLTLKNLASIDEDFAELFSHIEEGAINSSCKRVFKDSKVEGHYALIPTTQVIDKDILDSLSRDERRIYDLVVNSLFVAFMPPMRSINVKIVIGENETGVIQISDSNVYDYGYNYRNKDKKRKNFSGIKLDDDVEVIDKTLKESVSSPKSRFNDATIMGYMEKNNIGTEATRSLILESLLDLGYIYRYKQKTQLVPSDMAFKIVENFMAKEMLEPEFTQNFHEAVKEVENGVITETEFHNIVDTYIKEHWNDDEGGEEDE